MHGTLDPKKVKGKIVVCLRGQTARVAKGEEALNAGAVGMILCNDVASGNDIIADPHVLPASNINFTNGLAVYSYLNSTKYDLLNYFSPEFVHRSFSMHYNYIVIVTEIQRDILFLLIHNSTQNLLPSLLLSLPRVQTLLHLKSSRFSFTH